MHFEPLGDRVIVEVKKVDERKSASGIVIAKGGESLADKPTQGKVVAVGPGKLMEASIGCVRAPMNVKVGDEVVFQRYAPDELHLDAIAENESTTQLCVSQEDILAIIKE